MKYCHGCAHMTPGEPLFCNFCGGSYEVKLCPRLHPNSRRAEVCSQCGSRELSTPQPDVPILWKLLEGFTRIVSGFFLAILSLFVGAEILREILLTPAIQNGLVVLGFLLLAGWWLWSRLPQWFQKLVKRSLKRRERSDER